VGKLYKLPVRRADGSKIRVVLAQDGEIRVRDTSGTVHAVANSPDALPPTGRPFVRDASGAVRFLAYEEDWHSMDLTTLTRLKAHLGGISTSGSDSLLSSTITDVSYRMEKYLRRQILRQTNVQQLSLRRFGSTLSLDAYPVSSITSIKYAGHPNDFASVSAMSTDSYVLEDAEAGLIRFVGTMPYTSNRVPGYLQVTYVGGMASDTADFVLTWPDLARAADLQCAYEFMRRNTAGGNVSSDAGATAFTGDLTWLAGVLATLDIYRRHVIS